MVEDSLMKPDDSHRHVLDPIERIILRSMNEGVLTLECDGTIRTVNPSALRILGLEETQVAGRKFRDVFRDGRENDAFREIFAQVVHEGIHTRRAELQFKRPDGQMVDLTVASSFLDFDECTPGLESVVVVFRDITAFKSLERMKKRAVDHLSHELKTPLAIIQASVELLLDKGEVGNHSTRTLERIQRNLKRLVDIQSIVQEILEPAPFKPKAFPLVDTIEAVLDKLKSAFSHRSVALETQIEDVETDILDPYLLTLTLETLVKNAVENSPDGASVMISVRKVSEGILLEVEDRGIGIPVADQEFIFEGFHHTVETDDYASRKPFDFGAGGKGLELLRLRVLSESHPFRISFKSRRCRYIPTAADLCPGDISVCTHVTDTQGCIESGGALFSVLFTEK
jgi:PAS domain S-box-containing protein